MIHERRLWTGLAPDGHSLQVGRDPQGRWQVVYGGFSRATSLDLRVALAEATGAGSHRPWLARIEQEIEASAKR